MSEVDCYALFATTQTSYIFTNFELFLNWIDDSNDAGGGHLDRLIYYSPGAKWSEGILINIQVY